MALSATKRVAMVIATTRRQPATGAAIQLQGPSDGATWITLYSTTARGVNAEVITGLSSNLTAGAFQQHRVAIAGNGAAIYVAQAQFNADNTGPNEL